MVNGTQDRYHVFMDKDEYAAALAKLAALGDARKDAEARLKDLSEQSVAAVINALQEGIRPADVARSLHYTDGYVRRLRPKDVDPDPRYAHLKPPSRAKSAPTPELPTLQPTRRATFLAMADELTPERETELVELLHQRHDAWLKMAYRAGMTHGDLIRRAIKDGKLTASDLRS